MGVSSKGGGLYWEAGIDINGLRDSLKRGAAEVGQFTDKVSRQGKGMGNAFGQAGQGMQAFKAGLSQVSSNLGLIVGTAGAVGLVTVLTRQLMGLVKQTREFATSFELAMKEVQTISAATRANFDGISESIINMAANGPDNALDLAAAYYQIVSAGYDGAEGLRLLDISSKAATAGVTDTKTAADGLTTVMNAWGKSMSEAESVADIMFKTVERGKTTFPELSASMSQVAPIASSLKIPFEEIMALTASITKQGTPTAMAMTQIRAAMVGLAKQYGDTIFQGRTLQETFQAVAEESSFSIDKLIKTMGRIEGANAVLATTGEKFQEANADLVEMTTSVGSMMSAYDLMMEAVNNKWSVVHNRWTRELTALGNAIKLSSSGLADFLNRMLENREFDVIVPRVNSVMEGLEKELEGIEDKEEKLKRIQERIFELREERKGLAEEERVSEKQQSSEFSRFIEKFNAGLGLGSPFQKSLVKEVELDLIRESIEVNNRVDQGLSELFQRVLTGGVEAAPGGGNEMAAKLRTLSDMRDELKTLDEQFGTGTAAEDSAITRKMIALNDEIQKYLELIRKATFGDVSMLTTPMTTVKTPTIQKEAVAETLKETKKLTEEDIKRLKILAEQEDIINKQAETMEAVSEGFRDSSEILGALSFALGEVDQNLGSIVGRMADIAHNAGNLFAAIAAKDPISAITSGIGLVGNIIGLFKKKDTDDYNNGLEKINRTLERQSAIMQTMGDGPNYFTLAKKQVDELNKSLDDNLNKLRWSTYQDYYNAMLTMGYIAPTDDEIRQIFGDDAIKIDWGIDQFVEEFSKNSDQFSETQKDLIREILEGRAELLAFIDEQYRKTLGFGSSEVSSGILSGIEQGLSLGDTLFRQIGTEITDGVRVGIFEAETELGGFSSKFGELLKTTFKKNIIAAMNDQFLVTFMQRFNDAMASGGLDENERADLENLYVNAVKQAQVMWDNIAPILNQYNEGDTETGLSGLVTGITEETGSLIAGQFFAMRELQQRVNDTLGLQLDVMNQTLGHLDAIQLNTSYSIHLVQMKDDIFEMKSIIKERL